MKNRIRIGVLIFKDEKLLLVKHVDPTSGYTWWVPPGGGIEGNESIFDAAIRETKEETDLVVEPGKVVYFRQFIYDEYQSNNMDVYLTANAIGGTETIENLSALGTNDSRFIKELRYFSKDEMKEIDVYPKILKNDMWADREKGFTEIKFLGVQKDRE